MDKDDSSIVLEIRSRKNVEFSLMVNFLVKLWWCDRIDQFSRPNFDATKQAILLTSFYYYYKFLNIFVQKFKQLYRKLQDNNPNFIFTD